MAYAALVSLELTIDRLMTSPRISIDPPCPEIEHVVEQVQEFLQELDTSSEKLKNWDRKIREAACQLEDALESHVSNQFLFLGNLPQSLKINLQEVEEAAIGFEKLAKIREEIINSEEDQISSEEENDVSDQSLQFNPTQYYTEDQSSDPPLDHIFEDPLILSQFTEFVKEEEEIYNNGVLEFDPLPREDVVSSTMRPRMVGFFDQFKIIRFMLVDPNNPQLFLVPIFGMAGIGKTNLAKEIFEDPLISRHFSRRAWVKVGPKYELQHILLSILAQLNPDPATIQGIPGHMMKSDTTPHQMLNGGDDKLAPLAHNFEYLMGSIPTRFLLVLDDVWDNGLWDCLKSLFRDCKNDGSRVLMTTRSEQVARTTNIQAAAYKVRFLTKEESWYLLRERVFGQELCPPQLERAGKKIAKNCEGLPLTIVTVAALLSKADKTPEHWNKLTKKDSSLFVEAYDQMSSVLLPSYKYLPQHLKACFLFLGVFRQTCEIPFSKLTKLWSVDGLFRQPDGSPFHDCADRCLEELVSRCVVLVRQKRSLSNTDLSIYEIKSCSLHSSFWHLCKREAGKIKFFHILNKHSDGFAQGIERQRRLCIHNNILFGIKDVYDSMLDNCASTARSLLCLGPHHQYPVPICFELRLLRILDAVTIHLYEFPLELLKLIHLRYLALTANAKLPASISNLWHLEYLIVCRALSIKSLGAQPYMPMEIWDMKELKHLQFVGSDLPDPCGAHLPNLSTLLDVSLSSCTNAVLEGVPNLRKLGIRIELAPDGGAEPLSCFSHISHLHKLESLKCVIVNPNPMAMVMAVPPPLSASSFPECLRKLTMSGFGYPWEEMSKIAALPSLEVLKLQCYAFRGPVWEACDYGFPCLRFLLIEDTDLVHWRAGWRSFQYLERLSIKHCYRLQEIPQDVGLVRKIDIVDSSPWVVSWAEHMKECWNREYRYYYSLEVTVHSSWDDKKGPGTTLLRQFDAMSSIRNLLHNPSIGEKLLELFPNLKS